MSARPRHEYSRTRRSVMQAAMWVLFGATLALAAAVTHRQRHALLVPLADAGDQDGYAFRMPAGWNTVTGGGVADAQDRRVLARATEPGHAESARTVTVLRQPLGRLVSPAEYLHRSGVPFVVRPPPQIRPPHLDPQFERDEGFEPRQLDESLLDEEHAVAPGGVPVTVAGRPGLMVGGTQFRGRLGPRRLLVAATVLPDRQAVAVMLEGPGFLDATDRRIVTEMAEAIRPVAASTESVPGKSLVLGGGLGVTAGVPEGFKLVDDADPHRFGRVLIADDAPPAWTAIELVPCVLSGDERPQDLASMAELHDPAFHGAEPRQASDGRWVIDPPAAVGSPFATRAYLAATGTRGPALLAVFRGGLERPERFDDLWKQIEAGLRLDAGVDVAQMTDAGAAAAEDLSRAGLPALLGGGRAERWWLWFRDPGVYAGWSHGTAQSTAAGGSGSRDARWQTEAAGERSVGTANERWASDGSLSGYKRTLDLHASSTAGGSDASAAAPPRTTQHAVDARNGRFTVRTRYPNNLLVEKSGALPANFVPGGWLPWLVGRLPDGPLLLRTDSAPGYEHVTPSGLLSVLVALEEEESLVHPAEDGTGPMRCLTVHVNGSGEAQRWYFTRDGQPQKIEMSRGRHRTPSNLDDVRFGFIGDPRMSP